MRANLGRMAPPVRLRMRLTLALPLILFALTWATTFFTRFYILRTRVPRASLDLTLEEFSFALVLAAVAALVGWLVSLGITRPIRQLTESLREVPGKPASEMDVVSAANEIDLLSKSMARSLLSLNEFVSDGYIVERLDEGVIVLDGDGRIQTCNTVAGRLLGASGEKLRGKGLTALFPDLPQNQSFFELIREALKEPRQKEVESMTVQTADRGEVRLTLRVVSSREIWPTRGETVRVALFIKDEAEVERVRDRIRQMDRFALLGSLSLGLAHEIRNPLTYMQGLLDLLQKGEGDKREEYFRYIQEALSRLNGLIDDFLFLSPAAPGSTEEIDLHAVLSEGLAYVSNLAQEKGLTVVRRFRDGLPRVLGRTDGLHRAFVNLLRNACEASSPGGAITVETGLRPVCEEGLQGEGLGQELYVAVHNTGSYIDPGIRERIFSPFFTTKGRGSGLGLFIAEQIVRAHSGRLEVQSDATEGTTFRVSLPSLEGSRAAPLAAARREEG